MVYIIGMARQENISVYLEEITGEPPEVFPMPDRDGAPLPLFLRTLYELKRTVLFGKTFLLAFQKERLEHPTPSEYADHAGRISKIMDTQTILVLPKLPSYSRNRLVRQGVPFIVPGRQLFLPMLLIDLRERFPRTSRKDSAALSAPSQVLLLFYLLGNAVDGVSLRELAAKLGYSSMTLSNVRDELESTNLCTVAEKGRSRHLRFESNRLQLWETVRPRLRTPVKATHWVNWSGPCTGALASGLSALTEFSLIAEDSLPTFAMLDRTYRRHLERGELHGCPGLDEADAQLEAWKYDPAILAPGRTIDRLSLYLSLQHSGDERIQIALDDMLKEMPW
jgi:hypothetical protein